MYVFYFSFSSFILLENNTRNCYHTENKIKLQILQWIFSSVTITITTTGLLKETDKNNKISSKCVRIFSI